MSNSLQMWDIAMNSNLKIHAKLQYLMPRVLETTLQPKSHGNRTRIQVYTRSLYATKDFKTRRVFHSHTKIVQSTIDDYHASIIKTPRV